MTEDELRAYMEEENKKPMAHRFGHLCARCGKPILGDVVLGDIFAATRDNPPRWYHPECDAEPE